MDIRWAVDLHWCRASLPSLAGVSERSGQVSAVFSLRIINLFFGLWESTFAKDLCDEGLHKVSCRVQSNTGTFNFRDRYGLPTGPEVCLTCTHCFHCLFMSFIFWIWRVHNPLPASAAAILFGLELVIMHGCTMSLFTGYCCVQTLWGHMWLCGLACWNILVKVSLTAVWWTIFEIYAINVFISNKLRLPAISTVLWSALRHTASL